jgi:hypothetical protein
VIDREGPPADEALATFDPQRNDSLRGPVQGLTSNGIVVAENSLGVDPVGTAVRMSPAPETTEADQFERSAHKHDCEAILHDQLASETCGCLYFGFLHAAEAHRAAARQDRASAAAKEPGQQTP